MKNLKTTSLLSIPITTSPEDEILEYVFSALKTQDKSIAIFTPNPEIIVYAKKHPGYEKILTQAQITLPDGVGLVLAGSFLGTKSVARITGVDFMQKLCKESVRKVATTGFIGAGPGVALDAAKCLQRANPGMTVSFIGEEWETGVWVPEKFQKDLSTFSLSDGVARSTGTIDLLFVAFGFPKQEEWIARNLDKLPFRVAMGVGGSFDYITGKVSRAPKFLRTLGLEWAYRLVRQPWRIKRQLALLSFLRLVLQEKKA